MSIFSKIFKKNKVVQNSLDLVNINNFIVYPDESFYEEKENIELYKEFNNYYKEILNTHKSVTSKEFNIKEVDINLYTDIIKKLLFELDYTLDLVNNSEERNNINIKILYLKLKHYQNEINNYKNKLFIKLKVLNELYKRHIFSKNKREAIKSEITNIEFKIVISQSNFHALNLEINNYSSIINYTSLKEVDEKDYLYERDKSIKRYMSVFDLNYIENNSLSLVNMVANELILEKYLFTNKFDLESEFESIKEAHTTIEMKIQKLNIIIDKYMALKETTSKENKDLIKTIYDYKYLSIKGNHINNLVSINFLTFYKEELEYYENLILSEIEVFAKDKDKRMLDIYSKEFVNFRINEYERLVKLVRKLISCSNQNTFENRIILGIIFSLNNPKIIKEFFEKFYVDRNYFRDAGVVFYEKLYVWEEYIPLKSIMQIYKNGTSDNEFVQTLSSLYDLLNVECSKKEVKKIYEGVTKINTLDINYFKDFLIDASERDYIREVYDKLNYNGESYEVFLPSTINQINLSEFCKVYKHIDSDRAKANRLHLIINSDFNLNELHIVSAYSYDREIILYLNIKRPIKIISFESNPNYLLCAHEIIFDNILNEKTLNEECFYELLKDLFYELSPFRYNCLTKYITFRVNEFDIRLKMDNSGMHTFSYVSAEDFETYRRKVINKIFNKVAKVVRGFNDLYMSNYFGNATSLEIKLSHI